MFKKINGVKYLGTEGVYNQAPTALLCLLSFPFS